MHQKHSLLIEDHPDMQRACTRLLHSAGYTTTSVATLLAAHQYADLSSVELILLDLKLPDGDGLQFLTAVRERGIATPIIVILAEDSPRMHLRAGQLGASCYLVKPFNGEELLHEIHQLETTREAPHIPNLPRATRDAVIAYIKTHATSIGSRCEVAAHFNMNTKTVSRHVKHETGHPFSHVLYTYKLDTAKWLLAHTHLPIKDVARRSGFATHPHFTRIFTQREKCSPLSYRQQHNLP